jgi:hypothetical protein
MAWFLILFFLDALVDFLTVYGNFFRGIHANAHLVTFHAQNSHGDFVTYHEGFPYPASQNQHSFLLNGFFSSTGQQQSAKKGRFHARYALTFQILTDLREAKFPSDPSKRQKARNARLPNIRIQASWR